MAGTINETDMYNLLSKVFKPEVANTLLQQLKGETKLAPIVDRVMPGDLITSELMNQVIANIADLQTRIEKIDGVITAGGKVEITEPNPSRSFQIGDRLSVVGKWLGIDSTVKIEEAFIDTFEPGSDENILIIDPIPAVSNISDVGRLVTLLVNNPRGSASTTFWLKQPEITIPTGRVSVTLFEAPNDAKFEAKTDYFFAYRVQAFADMDETYDLKAQVDLGWAAEIVDIHDKEINPPEIFIKRGQPVSAGTSAFVRVKVSIPDGTANATKAKLQLRASSHLKPSITDTSDEYSIVVDSPPQQADKITFDVSSVKSPGSKTIDADKSVWVEIPKTDTDVQVTFIAQFPNDGSFTIEKPIFENDPNNQWSARISGASLDGTYSKNMTKPDETFMVYISAKGAAQAAKLMLQMKSNENATIYGSHGQDVRPK
jgi:hypothetical protein